MQWTRMTTTTMTYSRWDGVDARNQENASKNTLSITRTISIYLNSQLISIIWSTCKYNAESICATQITIPRLAGQARYYIDSSRKNHNRSSQQSSGPKSPTTSGLPSQTQELLRNRCRTAALYARSQFWGRCLNRKRTDADFVKDVHIGNTKHVRLHSFHFPDCQL
jgi:hypothetical protein